MPRILVCHHCFKLERLTDPPDDIRLVPATMKWDDNGTVRSYTYEHEDGTPVLVPEYDPLLEDAVSRHTHGLPDGIFVKKGIVEVYPVDQATWERLDVVTELKSELNKSTGQFYEESSHYKDGALQCYNEHNNPDLKDGCRDFLSDSKRIGPKMRNPKHQVYLCHMCLTGDTEVITRDGTRRIADLAQVGKADLLVPPSRGQWAGWKTVEVRSYGVAPVLTVTLSRNKVTKTVRATANHRWVVDGDWVLTEDLVPGMRLASSHAPPLSLAGSPVLPSPQGIAHGIVYGDGTRGSGDRPAWISLFGEDKRDLAKYFPLNPATPQALGDGYSDDEALRITGLPKCYKDAPDFAESRAYLYGFLAGYFAADGCVSSGGQATIESASFASMRLVKDICYRLGIQASPVTHRTREGIRGFDGDLYRVGIRADDLPLDFFLKTAHRAAITEHRASRTVVKNKRPDWKVVSVQDEGDVEEVFCAVVPDIEQFVLADNLVTGNCPYMQSYVAQEMRHQHGLYDGKIKKKPRRKSRR